MKELFKSVAEWYNIILSAIVTLWLLLFMIIGGRIELEIHWENVTKFIQSVKQYFNL